jgi:hypothetical protein
LKQAKSLAFISVPGQKPMKKREAKAKEKQQLICRKYFD